MAGVRLGRYDALYALRFHETGMIKKSPPGILAQNTDWRFLSDPKKELKG